MAETSRDRVPTGAQFTALLDIVATHAAVLNRIQYPGNTGAQHMAEAEDVRQAVLSDRPSAAETCECCGKAFPEALLRSYFDDAGGMCSDCIILELAGRLKEATKPVEAKAVIPAATRDQAINEIAFATRNDIPAEIIFDRLEKLGLIRAELAAPTQKATEEVRMLAFAAIGCDPDCLVVSPAAEIIEALSSAGLLAGPMKISQAEFGALYSDITTLGRDFDPVDLLEACRRVFGSRIKLEAE